METFSTPRIMYGIEFRKAALNLYFYYFNNMKKVAQALQIAVATLWRWIQNGIKPKRRQSIPYPTAILHFVEALVSRNNHLLQKDIGQAIERAFKVKASRRFVATALSLIGFTRKRLQKKGCSKKPNIEKQKQVIQCLDISYSNHLPQLVSIDEIGFDQRMTPIYGYSYKGTKAIGLTHPTNRKRKNVIMAIDSSGKRQYQIFDHSIGSLQFVEFIKAMKWPQGSILIMDNVAFHKHANVRDEIFKKGYLINYIPPYSPDCNPIENVFSVVKNTFRKLNLDHTIDTNDAILESIRRVNGSTFLNCFLRSQTFVKHLRNRLYS